MSSIPVAMSVWLVALLAVLRGRLSLAAAATTTTTSTTSTTSAPTRLLHEKLTAGPVGSNQAFWNISGTPNRSGQNYAAEVRQTNRTGSEEPRRFPANRTEAPSFASVISASLSGLVDTTYLEETSHFNRERIPERVVHAKGAGAFGVFEVTSTEIANYSKAALFNRVGRRTPVAARFSQVAGESGSPDTVRDVRGFAVKFYTDQGVWDLVGNNLPVFFISDPINFTPFIHSQKRNPQTHLRDPNALWVFVTLLPESLHTTLMLFTDRGIPATYREMHGFGVNTFKLVNARNEAFYAKFHWVCNQGIETMPQDYANKVAGDDPDFAQRDLISSINLGAYPSWQLKFQVMSLERALQVPFDVLDATKTWPHADFPLIEIGKMTLDRNVDNHFDQVEQLAFSPANMVPGIEASPDKMLLGRMVSYPDAQRYRLGANYADIPVNRFPRPIMTPTHCDGITYTGNQHCGNPNYLPLQYQGQLLEHERRMEGHFNFNASLNDPYNQPRALYQRVLTEAGKLALARNLANHLAQVTRRTIVERVLDLLNLVHPDLYRAVHEMMFSGGSS